MQIAAGLEYETRGNGEPVLFFHSGAVCDADLPLMSQPTLADFMLVRYRRRGYGGSARHNGPCSFKDQASDALALMTALGVQRAHVVSHSYAGLIALQLTLDFPEAVHSLVLSEPALGMLLPGEQGSQVQLFAGARLLAEAGDYAGAVNTILQFALGPTWRSDVVRMIPGAPEQVDRDAASHSRSRIPWLAGTLTRQPPSRSSSPSCQSRVARACRGPGRSGNCSTPGFLRRRTMTCWVQTTNCSFTPRCRQLVTRKD
jgi:pimeloyl-ACP methyl ester carboxylesterase